MSHREATVGEPLSRREQQVLALLADGCETLEIAAQLYLGESTVRTFKGRLYQKLGARNGPQAVHLAHRRGYLCADPAVNEDLATVRAAHELGYRIAIVPAQKGAA